MSNENIAQPELTLEQVLQMNVDQLKSTLETIGVAPDSKSKVGLQMQLIQNMPSHSSSNNHEEYDDNAAGREHSNDDKYDDNHDTETKFQSSTDKKQSSHSDVLFEQQLRLKELELQAEERKLELQHEHELRLRQLELQHQQPHYSRTMNPTQTFRVDTAVKLVPKFDETDVESFLLTFERIAQLNDWPMEKYSAILQAHLTGKALKVFSELSAVQCQHYETLKAALLLSYAVVPEVHRKKFRSARKYHNETYSEFAFRLSQSFKRWLEGEKAYDSVVDMREQFKLEQFKECLDSDLAVWLIEQKPKTLSEAARLSDQYTAIRKNKQQDTFKNKSFSNKMFNESFATQHVKSTTSSNTDAGKTSDNDKVEKLNSDDVDKSGGGIKESEKQYRPSSKIACFYCKKPGHVIANCRKRLYKESLKSSNTSTPINLVSKEQQPDSSKIMEDKQILDLDIDPGYREYCVNATLVKTDSSHRHITLLRDTGALQSLVSKEMLSENDYSPTSEFRLIKGVSGDTIRVPLVEMAFDGDRVKGTFLMGLVDKLPNGFHGLMGNDMCDVETCDILAVTRAQTKAIAT